MSGRLGPDQEASLSERRAARLGRQIAQQTDLAVACRLLCQQAQDLVQAEIGRCLLGDSTGQSLKDWTRQDDQATPQDVGGGWVGWVFQTGETLNLERLDEDARYEPATDATGVPPQSRALVVPLLGPRGRPVGVLEMTRGSHLPPFTAGDTSLLGAIGDHVGVPLFQLSLEREVLRESIPPGLDGGLFRPQALRHSRAGPRMEGDPLRASAGWMTWLYPLLIVMVLAGVLFGALAEVREYAEGPAVVQLGTLEAVTAIAPGAIASLDVRPGQHVHIGEVIARFHDSTERADFERVDREFNLHLMRRLRDPLDAGAEQALTALRPERERARKALEDRLIRTRKEGTVADIHVKPGQHLQAGQTVLTLVTEGPQMSIIALLPGRYRPYIRAGMSLRFQLQGESHAYRTATVERVGDQVLGPAAARRQLSEEISDAAPIQGPVVLAWARLNAGAPGGDPPEPGFYNGMWGRAQVPVRSERLLASLLPGADGSGAR